MANDNRLLQVMMEEEMGLTLRIYEHPLKQGFFAALGVLFSSFFLILGFLSNRFYEFFFFGFVILILISSLPLAFVSKKGVPTVFFFDPAKGLKNPSHH